ncbi:HAMP domain-containing protein [Kineococcus sp. LSe6-4]|uniref:histidine kinase n=1 Tax=Kineococcus halophytocola TaxID=3234027 RepID=A0ABV4H562_9ACTN
MTFLLRRVRVGARFAIAFGVILTLTLLTGLVAYVGSHAQSQAMDNTRQTSRVVQYATQQKFWSATVSGWQIGVAFDTYRIGTAAALDPASVNYAGLERDKQALRLDLLTAPLDIMTPREQDMNKQLITLWDNWFDFNNRALIAYRDDRVGDAENYLRNGLDAFTSIVALTDELAASVEARDAAAQDTAAQTARTAQGFIIGFAVLAVGLVALMLLALIRTVVTPLRQLTARADEVASERLPAAISAVRAMPADATPPTLPAFSVQAKDELADLAVAFNHVQDSALDLAVEQHRADRAAAEMLVNLGRRNQNLLSRTLAFLADLERGERDPQVLDKLFKLDHLSTRVRRNAESMLVLAGAEQTRAKSRPVKVASVVRAALAEIEDYSRVDLSALDDVTLHGSAAADTTHLLAELLENATAFSAGSTRVVVTGAATLEGGYRITIADAGIGMSAEELDEANGRIAYAALTRPDSRLLGHHVVGLLADRWSMGVVLSAGPSAGVVATVELPASLVVEAPVGAPVQASAEAPAEAAVIAPVSAPVVPVAEPALVAAVQAVQPAPVEALAPAPATPAPAPVRESAPAVPSARVRGAQLGELGRDLGRTADTGSGPVVASLPAQALSAPSAPVVPTRVRGAQLPDTGQDAAATATTSRSAEQVRRGLSGLQSGVSRARRDSADLLSPTTSDEATAAHPESE